jgi:single-strand DNA-binding protein
MGINTDINRVIITGRLSRDAELKYTSGGMAVCNFSLAFTRRQNKNGTWEAKSCFIECILWGKLGEVLIQYLLKGTPVSIDSQLDFDQWADHDNNKRSKHKLVVSEIKLHKKMTGQQQQESSNYTDSKNYEDDIPF